MTKQQQLEQIATEIKNCAICKKDKIGIAVPGEGNANAAVVFVGEAPGKNEAKIGRPFIGRSGKLLRKLITTVLGLTEEDVYITSPVKYLPIYITPKPSDIAHGKIHFDKQIAVINPKVIVLLGSTATKAFFTTPVPVMQRHGETIEKNNKTYFFTIHPAAALRFAKYMPIITTDFEKLKAILLRKI